MSTPRELLGDSFKLDQHTMNERWARDVQRAHDAGLSDEHVSLIRAERDGGACPRCQAPWVAVPVNNRYAEFVYYKPSCSCYPVCGRCGDSMHYQATSGGGRCGCGGHAVRRERGGQQR